MNECFHQCYISIFTEYYGVAHKISSTDRMASMQLSGFNFFFFKSQMLLFAVNEKGISEKTVEKKF